MRVLTVRQPYATRIVSGLKTVENRTRNTHLRGAVLIHAGAQLHERFGHATHPNIAKLPRASVVGSVQLIDSHRASLTPGKCCTFDSGAEWPDNWENLYEDRDKVFHWVLGDAVEFVTPIPHVVGALGFWAADDRVDHLASISETITKGTK